ncbi:preprotein translocase subunit SecG [Candidatus Microgenomates bacterium]|nr:preprotein translocase subunit SecG [Candidatus Microgenomates bacterium]
MDILQIIAIVQVIISVLLLLAVLLQSRGAGLSGTFGGDSVVYTTRRGPEKFLYWLTVFLAVFFVALAVASLLLK